MPASAISRAGTGAPIAPRAGYHSTLAGPSRPSAFISAVILALNQSLLLLSFEKLAACVIKNRKAPASAPSTCAVTRVRRTPSHFTRPSVSSIDSEAAISAMLAMAGEIPSHLNCPSASPMCANGVMKNR